MSIQFWIPIVKYFSFTLKLAPFTLKVVCDSLRNLPSHSQLYETIKSFTVRHLKFNLDKQILLLFEQIQNDIKAL